MKKGSEFFHDGVPQSREEPKVHRNISEYIRELSKHSNDFYQHLKWSHNMWTPIRTSAIQALLFSSTVIVFMN